MKKTSKSNHLTDLLKQFQLPKILKDRNKYQAGYLIGYAGSKIYCGAPKLSGFAALRAGAGIVQIFHPEEIGPAPFELICQLWDEGAWKEALKRANAVFVGPGLTSASSWLKSHLEEIKLPCVIDAGALLLDLNYPKSAILTPHRGEALSLLGLKQMPTEQMLFAKVNEFCKAKQVFVVLKGAVTIIFSPEHSPVVGLEGDPGMATAGTGDVLTGVIGALLAQGSAPHEAAVLGVALHSIAGKQAAEQKSSYSLIASDLIDFLPVAFQTLLVKPAGN